MTEALRHAITVAGICFLINLPLGYLRGGVRPGLKRFPKGSPERRRAFFWTMVYIHLSIPVVALLRRHWGLKPWYVYVPVFVVVALAAQALGERYRLRRDAPEPPEHEDTGEIY